MGWEVDWDGKEEELTSRSRFLNNGHSANLIGRTNSRAIKPILIKIGDGRSRLFTRK